VVVKPDRRIQGVTSERVVLEILDSVSVPISEGVR
jgi:hypothetical protein